MKDGRTHLAHTAEHAVDLDTGAIVGVTVQDASAGDTTTLVDTLVTAAEQVEAVGAPGIAEVVADKGYHSNETMVGFAAIGVRSYVSEPDRGRRHWKGQAAARDAVYANRRRIRGARGKRLLRQRGELLERPNAHLYETGRMRRVHLRGHPNILKRLLVQVCGVNLGLLMRHLTGVGTPRSLQGRASALVEALIGLLSGCWGRVRRVWAPERHDRPDSSWDGPAVHANTDTRFSIDNQPLLPRAASVRLLSEGSRRDRHRVRRHVGDLGRRNVQWSGGRGTGLGQNRGLQIGWLWVCPYDQKGSHDEEKSHSECHRGFGRLAGNREFFPSGRHFESCTNSQAICRRDPRYNRSVPLRRWT